ncbi:hypothetical protein A1O3_03248 [Capronia epimyces CBS 606.96]|uniref:Short-chain dehydrogenase/reductase 3 n=1 Tax=Capronia epimyces CBS 606.96 TaxID=1182542 RepID=W9Z6P1_9EURO|nr:uncharacterized protein A1O3_03248 [Capronia epimyces CBS 606.96]EXJ90179.1 hypothetical protein A1O3_03248 [Capronia epimyces CBS 606.96]
MQFSIGHVLEFVDQTFLNPWVSIFVPVALQLFTTSKLSIHPDTKSFLGYRLGPLPNLQSKALKLVCAGLILRINRVLSRRAMNNGVEAKFDWDKEIILVTGAAGGIGAEAAQKFAKRGSKVIVLDVLPLTYKAPSNLFYYQCDITSFDKVQALAGKIREEVGDPTCVVANAGICRGKPILQASSRDIELTFSVNNLGILWIAKAFLPSMAEHNHGHFLITASQAGYVTTSGVVDYGATKAAAVAIFEGLQTELKHVYKAPAVRVSVINPSAVKTKMFDGLKAPSNFIMPRLSPADVGERICEIVWSGRAQNVMIPAFSYIAAPARCLPDWVRVGFQDGGADAMTELRPHQPLK